MYQLYNGDCVDILSVFEDESIDLIITDPPYGIDYNSNYIKNPNKVHDNSVISNDNEQVIDLLDITLEECKRVLKDKGAIYIFCGYQHLDSFIQLVRKYFDYKNILVWLKNNWTAGDLKGNYGTRTEYIIYATKNRHILNGRRDTNLLEFKRVPSTQQYFKFQKPVDLLEFLIQKSSNEGDTVLDPFCGSGSTLVATQNLGRRGVGIEIDDKLADIITERLKGIGG